MNVRAVVAGFGCAVCAVGVYQRLAPWMIIFMFAESMALLYVAGTFARSLKSTPFVTRIATRAKGAALEADEHDYTRALTEIWVGVLTALAAMNLIVMLAPSGTYGLAERVALDCLPLSFFLMEHFYRRLRFAHIWKTPSLVTVIGVVISERYGRPRKDRS